MLDGIPDVLHFYFNNITMFELGRIEYFSYCHFMNFYWKFSVHFLYCPYHRESKTSSGGPLPPFHIAKTIEFRESQWSSKLIYGREDKFGFGEMVQKHSKPNWSTSGLSAVALNLRKSIIYYIAVSEVGVLKYLQH